MNPSLTNMSGKHVVIGLLSGSHLGDVLCTTPLPRLLAERYGWEIRITEHRSTRGVFVNNPHIAGFQDIPGEPLYPRLRGRGHVIQRLQQGFGLPVDPWPQPELYLDEREIQWAKEEQRRWPQDRPACIISTRVLTDMGHFNFDQVDWAALAEEWSRHCTIVQPVMTHAGLYQDQIAMLAVGDVPTWRSETILPGAIVYRDLSLRQYLSLFAVADYFCGGTSGGAHVAAAFRCPSLIIVWHKLLAQLSFPFRGPHLSTGSFLYPQHHFLEADRVCRGSTDHLAIKQAVRLLVQTKAENIQLSSQSMNLRTCHQPLTSHHRILRGRRGRLVRLPLSYA
ncbi:MAG: hypothetical protein IT541_09575 [Hyphomicrobiales bacterium]|nr:hypothetical protein [Hyphomicrobiales bacterium]